MKYPFIILFISLFFLNHAFSQFDKVLKINNNDFSISPSYSYDDSKRRECPSAIYIWNNNIQKNENGAIVIKLKSTFKFTCFGIGWTSDNNTHKAGNYYVDYKVKTKNGNWSQLYNEEGYVSPNETPTNMYWTDLLFNTDETPQDELEFFIYPPAEVEILKIRLDVMDVSNTGNNPKFIKSIKNNEKTICPYYPNIIPRSDWCGSYTACHNTTSYTNITATHTVIHHGASPDTYTDGAAVVRGYWNYHVNSNGWADIGYNYLFDKYGNMFLGRHNPNVPNTDVRGAHAGASNNYSIGLNFLGNADITLPTEIQLDTVQQFLAWWYDYKSFDPTSSANIVLQSGGTGTVPRICGHKDVNIGGTSCPGTTLYGLLPDIRTNTKNIINACSSSTPTDLNVTHDGCPDNNYTFSWTNSGTAWWINVSDNSSFTNPYIKWVSNLTSYTGPFEFVLESDGTTPLVLTTNQTYYWRIWNGTTYTSGNSFTVPNCDNTAPTTEISTPNIWKTNDFTATFTDTDDDSGIEKSYYQVLDYNGTEWRANNDNGFFADNFETNIHADWTNYSGTWQITSNALHQTDESDGNSNIYAPINQTLSNRYLYNFTAKVLGSEPSRRFGFHFFCDDANLENRGNSYFVWFRIEEQTLEFYKVTDNVISQELVLNNIATSIDQWYDFKIIFDRITGKVDVYRDNIVLGTWTDASPHTSGNYISFRSGNMQMMIAELKIYRSRYPSLTVTVGEEATNDIRYQNPSPTTYGAKIKSIVNDANGNISEIAYHDLNIDWTAPSDVVVYDGLSSDIDTITVTSSLSANWTASEDVNSDIAKYWYSIGTSQGANDITDWTDNGLNTNFTQNGLNLSQGQNYFINIKAENNAGLISNVTSSDGQMLAGSTVIGFTSSATEICLGDTIQFTNTSINADSYVWTFEGGNPNNSIEENPSVIYETEGIFSVSLQANGLIDTLYHTESNLISVDVAPIANFSVSDTLFELPNALALFENLSENANSYIWDFGDGSSTSDYAPWHIYDTTGYFTVSLIANSNSCGNDTLLVNDLIHVNIIDNIQYIELENINIYPNPFSDNLTIEYTCLHNETISISLINLLGKEINLVSNKVYSVGKHDFSISTKEHFLSDGVYILKLKKDKKLHYYKIVKN